MSNVTAFQVGPFLRSVIASGERLTGDDVADIERAIEAEAAALDVDVLASAEQDVAWAFGVLTRLAWPGSIADFFTLHGLPGLIAEYEQARANVATRRAILAGEVGHE